MSRDVKKLAEYLSRVARASLRGGEDPRIAGATIDAWGQLERIEPPPVHRYSPKRQIEHLEASYRQAATLRLCRACAYSLQVNVDDRAGRERVAILVSVETSAGQALDVFLPLALEEEARDPLDVDSTFIVPRAPRVFVGLEPSPEERRQLEAVEVAASLDRHPAGEEHATPERVDRAPRSSTPAKDPSRDTEAPSSRREGHAEVQTRFLAAIVRSDLEIMDRARQQGARLDEALMGQTPVELALRGGSVAALDWLLTRGAPLPELGLTAWRELHEPGRRPVLQTLLRHGVRAPRWYPAVDRLLRMRTTQRLPILAGPWAQSRSSLKQLPPSS